jgi:hypothetical protein
MLSSCLAISVPDSASDLRIVADGVKIIGRRDSLCTISIRRSRGEKIIGEPTKATATQVQVSGMRLKPPVFKTRLVTVIHALRPRATDVIE